MLENIHIIQKKTMREELRGDKILRHRKCNQHGRYKSNSVSNNISVPVHEGIVRGL